MRRAAFLLWFLLLASSAAAQFNTIWGVTTGQFSLWGLSIPQPTVNGTVLTYTTGPAALSWAAGGGGANPAGTGSELQFRLNATTFGAVTGSSVSGSTLTLGAGATTSALTDLLINPAVKTSGNLIDAQVGGVSKFNVTNIGSVNMSGTLYAYNLAPSGDLYLTKGTTVNIIPEIDAGTASTEIQIVPVASKTPASGTETIFAITPIYNEATGTAANTDLLINRTETAVGSGAQKLISAGTGGGSYVEKFAVSNTGVISSGGNAGMTTVVTVRNSGGSADCTISITGGLVTATTCSHS